jgi:mRNA interferase YafQ
LKIFYTTQFKIDYKRIKKQQKEISKLISVIDQLAFAQKLEKKYLEHQLIGEWKNHKDCHIEADWILIFRLTEDTLILERTGSHSELFKK